VTARATEAPDEGAAARPLPSAGTEQRHPTSSTAADAPVSPTGWFYWVTKAVLTPLMLVYFRPHVQGRQHLPRTGPAILASNHTSYLDWLALPLVVVRRRIVFLAKSEYFDRPGVTGRAQRFFFSATGQVPVDRTGGPASTAALRTAARLLQEGSLLGVFPEGTRSKDGRLQPGRTGLARMAAQTGVPVVPCATIGTYDAAPAGVRLPRPKRLTVRFGEPLSWPAGTEPTSEALRTWTDALMEQIRQLSGQLPAEQAASVPFSPTD
jgi:1-acyl-sn-glycerol-3-phosphate acyltransferase